MGNTTFLVTFQRTTKSIKFPVLARFKMKHDRVTINSKEYLKACEEMWKKQNETGSIDTEKNLSSKTDACSTLKCQADIEDNQNQFFRRVGSISTVTCICKKESRFCPC